MWDNDDHRENSNSADSRAFRGNRSFCSRELAFLPLSPAPFSPGGSDDQVE